MKMLPLIAAVVRALQTIFGIVILGLAVTLFNAQRFDSAPTTTKYSIFTGAVGIIVGLVGLVTLFIDSIPTLIAMAFDAVGGLLLLAGGIAWAIGLGSIDCTSIDSKNLENMLNNGLINEGKITINGKAAYGIFGDGSVKDADAYDALKGNCIRGRVDEIFQFISFAFLLVLILFGFLLMKKRGQKATFV